MARVTNDKTNTDIAGSDAKDHPVIRSTGFDSQENETGQGSERVMRSTGDAKESLDKNIILANWDFPVDTEYMAMMAFMAEPVTVRINTTSDPNADQIFEININGNLELFRRGETKTVKRYFVDRLCRLKTTRYTQREVVNHEGIRDYVNEPHTALLYEFNVVRDDNPRGADWLRHVQNEPG